MFIGLTILVVLGNLVHSLNETEFINSLPENEKNEFLDRIGRRVSKEVKVVRRTNATQMEASEAQMNEFDDIVTKIIKEEKNKSLNNLNGTSNKAVPPLIDILKQSTLTKPAIKEHSKTKRFKSDAKEDSKIIKIPFKLLEPEIHFSDNKENIDVSTVTPTPNESITNETEISLSDESTTSSILISDATLFTLDPETKTVTVSRKFEDLTTKEYEVTTSITTDSNIKTIDITPKPLINDSNNVLKFGEEILDLNSDSEENFKRIQEKNRDLLNLLQEDKAKKQLNMNAYEYQSSANPENIKILGTEDEKSGEQNYSIVVRNTTLKLPKPNENIGKNRRHTNNLRTLNAALQPSRRSEHYINETDFIFSHNKHPWPQDQRNKYLKSSQSLLTNETKPVNVNLSKTKNSSAPYLDTSEHNNSLPKSFGLKLPLANNYTEKLKKNITRQIIINNFNDAQNSDAQSDEYTINNEQPNHSSNIVGSNSISQENKYSSQLIKKIQSHEGIKNITINKLYDPNYGLFEDATNQHIEAENSNPFVNKDLVDVASTSFTIDDKSTQKPLKLEVQTIPLPNSIQTTHKFIKEPKTNDYKLITKVSTPLNTQNKTVLPTGLIESTAYQKNKKINKKKKKPLKLHITSGQNPVNIKIFYGKNIRKPKKLKISFTRDDSRHSYSKTSWKRRNLGDNRAVFVSDFYPSNGYEYTTLPSYLSYVPSLAYRPDYYKPEIPYTLFSKRKKQKIPEQKDDDRYFGHIIDKPGKLATYKGQGNGGRPETHNSVEEGIIKEINSFLAKKNKKITENKLQKVGFRNDRYLSKNPSRCRYSKRTKNDGSESDCRSSEEYDDSNSLPANETSNENETSKLIAFIAVFAKNNPKIEIDTKTDDKNNFQNDVLNVKVNAHQSNNQEKATIFKNFAAAEYLKESDKQDYSEETLLNLMNSQQLTRTDKEITQCLKQYNLEIYVEAVGMLILKEEESLRAFDWLGSTVDIQGGIQKLLILSNKLINQRNINQADLELLKFVIYLRKLAAQRRQERERCMAQIVEPDFKVMQKHDWMLHSRKPQLTKYYNQNGEDTEIVELISFLNVLQSGLYDLHTVIKQIAGVTQYNKQNWFYDIKNLYLDYANRQDLLGVLLHLSLTKIIDHNEITANNGLTYNYVQYIIDHQDEVQNIVDEFDFCYVITKEMEKNIFIK